MTVQLRLSVVAAAAALLLLPYCRPAGAVGPNADSKTTKSVDASAPSVVILPPRLPLHATSRTRIAAELLCDRLAQEIDAAGLAQVVDRSQLEQVLKEKEILSAGPITSIVSYDAMVCVEVDSDGLVPKTHIKLVDLSTGNMLGEKSFGWPVREQDMEPVRQLFRTSLSPALRTDDGKLKVRAFLVPNSDSNARMRPLATRLGRVFDEALARSDRIRLVHHLEAGTSKEESLLLLMGLSRLPGRRRFVPQADATVELRVNERDSIGKSFKETPVEIGVRVRKGTDCRKDWVTTSGKVKDFDLLVQQAWEKFAKLLAEAKPAAAAQSLDEMAVRRRQAEAELRAARALFDLNHRLNDTRTVLRRLAHTEAAMKIDPTYEMAAYEHIRTLGCVHFSRPRNAPVPSVGLRILQESVRYFERFGGNPERDFYVHDDCRIIIHGLWFGRPIELTPERLQMLDATKQIMEYVVVHQGRALSRDYILMATRVVYRGMKLCDVPMEHRKQWLASILDKCNQQDRAIRKIKYHTVHHSRTLENNRHLRACIASLRIADNRLEPAEKPTVVAKPKPTVVAQPRATGPSHADRGQQPKTREVGTAVDDAKLRANLDSLRRLTPLVKIVTVRGKGPDGQCTITPLAEAADRLYVVWGNWKRRQVGYLSLDKHGRPIGEVPHGNGKTRIKVRVAVNALPQPNIDRERDSRYGFAVACAKFIDGRLYLGMKGHGLLVFDPNTEQWTTYGPEQGLSAWGVYSFFPIDDHTLYCTGYSDIGGVAFQYTFDIRDGKVTLFHQTERHRGLYQHRLQHGWRNGQKLMAVGEFYIWDDLLTPKRKCVRLPENAYSQRCTNLGTAQIGKRRFFLTNIGLYEFDQTGKILRRFWAPRAVKPTGLSDAIALPDPRMAEAMVQMGPLLAITSSSYLQAFDPETDTWYGPLKINDRSCHPIGTHHGLWLDDGLRYVDINVFHAAARQSDRPITTDESRRCKQLK